MSGSGAWRWERLPGCWGIGVCAGWRAVRASWAVSRPTGCGRWCGPQAAARARSGPGPGPAGAGRAGSAWGPGVPVALDVQVHPEVGRRADPAGAPGGRGHGGRAAPRPRGSPWEGPSRTTEGARHPDRDAQFRYINGQVKEFTAAGQPVISVDTKNKEVLGEQRGGRAGVVPGGAAGTVRAHDFPEKGAHKAVPYGIYDWPPTPGGCRWAAMGTPPRSRSRPCAAGGTVRAGTATWRRPGC